MDQITDISNSSNKITVEFKKIRMFASYNGCPKNVVNAMLKKHKSKDEVNNHNNTVDEDITKLYLTLP